jgi:hypothetical protein
MLSGGEYLLGNVGFNAEDFPVLTLQKDGAIANLAPLNQEISLIFDTSSRYCIGWGDISTGERFVCPDSAVISEKYEQCPACQKRTGFNPAFYHATSVSKQQEARNQEPHFLYLAYFGPSIIKVGISHAKRGNARLLEQGARAALILETFPTAMLARQYEAQIANLENIAETIQLRKKQQLLSTITHDHDLARGELLATKEHIQSRLGVTFKNTDVLGFDNVFFPTGLPKLTDSVDCTEQKKISGKALGMIGSILFCTYNGTLVHLPIKKLIGYPVELRFAPTELSLPAQQISLF